MQKGTSINKKEVESLFDSIAGHYDFLNRLLSFGADIYWRRKAIRTVKESLKTSHILDVACGTGDLAIEAAKLNPEKITGIDISEKMLETAKKKITRKRLSHKIELLRGDSENLPFGNNQFDLVMCAFGVRNFNDRMKSLKEMSRVLRNEGMVLILEFSKPDRKIFGKIFEVYFFRILPYVGKLISGSPYAYRYLPESVYDFPSKEEFSGMMKEADFTGVRSVSFTGGIVTIYRGFKMNNNFSE